MTVTASDIHFEYDSEGSGWYCIYITLGDRRHEVGGSSYSSDALGNLLRAGMMMIAGAPSTDVWIHQEPSVERIRFEREILNHEEVLGGSEPDYGCRVYVHEIDQFTMREKAEIFVGLVPSQRAVAEAIHAMAVPHFTNNADDPAYRCLGKLLAME